MFLEIFPSTCVPTTRFKHYPITNKKKKVVKYSKVDKKSRDNARNVLRDIKNFNYKN